MYDILALYVRFYLGLPHNPVLVARHASGRVCSLNVYPNMSYLWEPGWGKLDRGGPRKLATVIVTPETLKTVPISPTQRQFATVWLLARTRSKGRT